MRISIYLIYIIIFIIQLAQGCYEDRTTCDERVFDRDSFVCVCDGEYCDVIGDVSVPPYGKYKRIISSREKHRFSIIEEQEMQSAKGDNAVVIDFEKTYQTILGFGGAFTDSAGMAITSLSNDGREELMKSYFSKDGIEYNLCRIPIAGTDFSTHPYSYDEVENDVALAHFALTEEDYLYKIPLVHQANELSANEILYFGSPWSPPPWMKENGKHNGKGGLLKAMYDPFANYMIRFIEEYEKHNISMWGLTTMNEPTAGFLDWAWNACAFSAEDMRDWIRESFGPALEKSGRNNIKVMVYDQARGLLPAYPSKILSDKTANKYVDGVAVHWYMDFQTKPETLDEMHSAFQDKFILYTEACEGFASAPEDKVQLGSWERAENYTISILNSLNHYSTGWVDWNIALNTEGGPNWANNVVDAPIIVNKKNNEFYKQPMFYAMGHFSKFVKPGSKRLLTTVTGKSSKYLKSASFINNEENMFVIVILNKNNEPEELSIQTVDKKYINIKMNSRSIETILIKMK